MSFHDLLTRRFLNAVLETPEGRAFLFNQIADAEDNGEATVFDEVIAAIDDPTLSKIVDRHRRDEIRHGELFRAARDRTGVDPGPVPEEIKVLDRINAHLGGFFDRPITDLDGVVEAYLILQVIEERATTQFHLIEASLRDVDPESAARVREIADDEARHLKYCRAVVKRYASNPAFVERRLGELRRIEAVAFRETTGANLAHALLRGFIKNPVDRAFFRAVRWLGDVIGARPMTHFARPALEWA